MDNNEDIKEIVQTWLFQFVGDDTTDEVRLRALQSRHQVVQLFLESLKNV